MNDTEIKERAKSEHDRIATLLTESGVSERRMKVLEPVIVNTAWMKVKLDDARESIKNSQIAISYDNGGGQKGIRENPLFSGYEKLWRSYMAGMNRILDSMPDDGQAQIDEIKTEHKTMLELVRAKHKVC